MLADVCCSMAAVGVGELYEKDDRGVPDLEGGVKVPGEYVLKRFFFGRRNVAAFDVEVGA